jgi:ribosomal-protein-alanine N-acetyltransferase
MELLTQRLRLREFEEGDYGALREIEAAPETYRYEPAAPDAAETRQYIHKARLCAQTNPRERYALGMTIQPGDEVQGRITLSLQNAAIDEWEIGWAVHPEQWRKGFATEAALGVIHFAFGERKVHRIVAFCHVLNTASVRVMEKLGMQREGRIREVRRVNGSWHDEYVYAILERDWQRIHEKTTESTHGI